MTGPSSSKRWTRSTRITHNAEYARREFTKIRYKGIDKEAVTDYLTRLWHAASKAWPAAGGALNEFKRGGKVKEKVWDSMPAETRERLYVHFNGNKDTCDIDLLARHAKFSSRRAVKEPQKNNRTSTAASAS